MKLGEIFLKGSSKKEIFFSSYICHPSMANNDYQTSSTIKNCTIFIQFKKRKYSQEKFSRDNWVNCISKSKFKQNENIICGYNLSCVGDDNNYSLIKSQNENYFNKQ